MISLLLFAVSVGLLWRHPGRRTALWLAVASFLYAVLCITRAAMTHFTAQGLTEAVVFTLLHDVGNAGVGGYWKLIVACTLGLLLVGALSYGVYRLVRRHPPRRSAWWRLAWVPMVGAVVLNPLTQDAYGLARFYAGTGASTEFDKYYLPYTKAGEAYASGEVTLTASASPVTALKRKATSGAAAVRRCGWPGGPAVVPARP
ncbi:hypothetical protein [Xenophilus azovorans]|uniref:hypothetical protein n=1 Tax=Xenophilus azovorans TaxID=151755 RepID=UPI001B80A99E|nr:hypothetical protein [Xenophilus azovorans]